MQFWIRKTTNDANARMKKVARLAETGFTPTFNTGCTYQHKGTANEHHPDPRRSLSIR